MLVPTISGRVPQFNANSMILANVALPAFLPHSFATLIGIIVIAAIEGWFLQRGLKAGYSECYRASIEANLKSTLVGIPLAWLLWVLGLIPLSLGVSALGLKTHPLIPATFSQTAFAGGIRPTEWTEIASASAWILMLIPFYLGSVWIETKVISKRFKHCKAEEVSRAVVRGNLATYCLFLLLGVFALVQAIGDHPRQKERFERMRIQREERNANNNG
jgi:hypothetical protein